MNNKICLFLSELYSPVIGGSCALFEGRFKNHDKILTVITNKAHRSEEFDKSIYYRIKRVTLKSYKLLKGFEWTGISFSLFFHGFLSLLTKPFDYIECSRPLPEGISGLILSILFRKKLVVNVHGEEVSVLSNYRIERILLRILFNKAHLIISNSTFTESLVRKLCATNSKMSIIYPGFNPDKLISKQDSISNAILKIFDKKKGPFILTVGRLQERKGQDKVIQSLPLLMKTYPDLSYIITGSIQGGSLAYKESLEQMATTLNVAQNVVFTGEVNTIELQYLYTHSNLFILANRLQPGGDVEGFGIVFLEAGYFNLPVIGGNCGGSTDAIIHGKTGLVIDTQSEVEIAHNIVQILSNPEMGKAMGIAGKEFALSLTVDKMRAQYVDLIANLLNT